MSWHTTKAGRRLRTLRSLPRRAPTRSATDISQSGWLAQATLLAVALLLAPTDARAQQAKPVDPGETHFETQIRPVLAGKCRKCHGAEQQSGGLDLRSREALLRGGDSGPAVSLETPAQSLLLKALRREDDVSPMPPDDPLPSHVAAEFARWIEEGAYWPASAAGDATDDGSRHWAFRPLGDPQPPLLPGQAGGPQHPIDCFLAAERTSQGLVSAPPAASAVLVRRLYFDLWGLPPTPEDVAQFAADDAPDAWPRWIDRLLASPHYGQRWGRHWLDLARYADTAGDNADYPVPELALYRDWVIAALNVDLPYDQFLREQIAGDLLASGTRGDDYAQHVIATGYLALARRYATGPYELWHLTLEDAIDALGRSVMGLSLRCARCHDHKYDPVTMRDYYALYGIFASTQFPYAGSEEFQSKQAPRQHFAALVPPNEAAPRWAAHRQAVMAIRAQLDAAQPKPAGAEAEAQQQAAKELQKTLRRQLRRIEGPGAPAELPVAYAVAEGQPADAAMQMLGDPGQPGETVARGPPPLFGVTPPPVPAGASGRLQLANWLTDPQHPLTARVIVNRLWQHHFGRGLVGTPSDFGLRGEPPTHPELLDWLARRLIDSGWSLKYVHRLILTSQAYRQSSLADPAALAIDPGNRTFHRQNRRRLEAEPLRDAALFAAGRLDVQRPAPHPFPAIEEWRWTQHAPFRAVYSSPSRSVNLMTQRLVRHPYLALFDAPDTNTTSGLRTESTVPLQALFFLNEPWWNEQAAAFASRLLAERCDAASRVELAIAWAWSRTPLPAELQRALAYVERYEAAALEAGMSAQQAVAAAWTSLARTLLSANEFVYVD